MPQPPPRIREGYFNIYLEKIDSLLMALAYPPKCAMCDELFKLGDKAIVIRIRGMPVRYDMDCYNQLAIGISMFNKNFDIMEEHGSGLQ